MNILRLYVFQLLTSILSVARGFEVFSGNLNLTEGGKDFGSLNTMQDLIHWSKKEEAIYKLLKLRRDDLQQELALIDR